MTTEWRRKLVMNAKGEPKNNVANVLTTLSLHPAWQGIFAYDAASLHPHAATCFAG